MRERLLFSHMTLCGMEHMIEPTSISRSANVIRWAARIWSFLILLFTILRIFTPDPSITGPVPIEDWFLLSLWGVAELGLVVSWRWATAGAIITIGTLSLREIAWIIMKGRWIVNFLIVWAFIVPPAILFLIAQRLEREPLS